MHITQEMPAFNSKLLIWVFIPYRITQQGMISQNYDNAEYRQELTDVFSELGIAWKWQPITLENMHTIVEAVIASSKEYIPLVLNYCDGFEELDGYPGFSLLKLLEEKGVAFTGADTSFCYLCDNKILMKHALLEAGVTTSSFEAITNINHVEGVCDRLGTPLIVKPATSYGSHGISLDSVISSDEQLTEQIYRLTSGQHGMQFPSDSIFVERFINGPEFTVFIVGSAQEPEHIKAYPAMERVFHNSLPETERFLVFSREKGEQKSSSPQKSLCRYQLAASEWQERLCELSKHAYCAVGGNGYGRIDVRMDKDSQEFFILEVNPNCALSSSPISEEFNSREAENDKPYETSVGTILSLASISFAQVMLEIITGALARNSAQFCSTKKAA